MYGKLKYEGEYKYGNRHGKGKEYDYGKLQYEGEYYNGKRTGYGKEYYFNGELKREGRYFLGSYQGNW